MKKTIALAAGIFAISASQGALTYVDQAWENDVTEFDAEIDSLLLHMSDDNNFYLEPDRNFSRDGFTETFSAANGDQFLNLFAIGSTAGDTHNLGIRIDGYSELVRLTPDDDSGIEGYHSSKTFNELLNLAPGSILGPVTFDLFILTSQGDTETNLVFSDGTHWDADGNPLDDGVFANPLFDFNGELLGPGFENPADPAVALPVADIARNLLFPFGDWRVLGFEDDELVDSDDSDGNDILEPDYNDLIVAFQVSDKPITEVPEPSTYGMIGAAALLGLIVRRRLKAKTAVAAE